MNLALKYRPISFSNLLGQESIKSYFKNSFAAENFEQAFLFVGMYGIGKTSLARILAKCYNCLTHNKPNFENCGKCDNCLSIEKSNNIDVLEFDAASHTGVDDIRVIINSMQYTPTKSRYKIYIIDEVHMLSKSAFNSILKTLEEPPKHVVFILATTELQKIPNTIISRCQVFQLRAISDDKLAQHLCNIAKNEGFKITLEAANIIAQKSYNSVRDALSLLQQVFFTTENKQITSQEIRQTLYLIDENNLHKILQLLFNGDEQKAVQIFNNLLQEGFHPLHVLNQLLEYIYQNLKNTNSQFSKENLHHSWQILLKAVQTCKANKFHRMIAEMTLMQIAYLKILNKPDELLKKIAEDENSKDNLKTSHDGILQQSIKNNLENSISSQHAPSKSENNGLYGHSSSTNISQWHQIKEKIKNKDIELYELIDKYISDALIEKNQITLIFNQEYNAKNESIALNIKEKFISWIDDNAQKILIKFHAQSQLIKQKISDNFDLIKK